MNASTLLLAVLLLLAADPPADQAKAQTAIDTARSAVSQADAGARADAEKRLAEAVEHLKAARYDAAKQKADEAWELVAREAGAASKFTVLVSDGGTEVTHVGGQAITVQDNRGKNVVLAAGQKVMVADAQGRGGLAAPSLLYPGEQARIRLKPTERGLGPVTLTWTPVAGAKEYEVEYQVGEGGKPSLLKAQRAEVRLPPLPQGRVLWAVRSVSDGATSEPSARRWFELQPEQIKLEVKPGGGWR